MQIGIHISLMRDIMGATFTPGRISLAYPQAHDFGLPTEQIGCPLSFASSSNGIVFRSAWLNQAANLGNRTTYPAVVALCDDLLVDLKSRIGVAGEIRALLLRELGNPPSLAAIAKRLEVSDRSLRRQLREQGISFRGLLDELRMQVALKYLRTTRLANEDIALALGFSDAAKFPPCISSLDQQVTQRDQSEIGSMGLDAVRRVGKAAGRERGRRRAHQSAQRRSIQENGGHAAKSAFAHPTVFKP
jgi:AraC-like DNA-binding protein